jgi:hypothetical protein
MASIAYGFPSYSSPRHRFGVTVELYRHVPGATVDGYAEPDEWSGPVLLHGCAVAPGAVVEAFEPNRDGAGVEFTIYAPPGVDVGSRDRVKLPGHTEPFEITGSPQAWGRNPFTGGESGVVLQVGRFEG